MTAAVYKYTLQPRRVQHLLMPAGARLLSVGAQGEDVVLWAAVTVDESTLSQREVVVVATGEAMTIHEQRLRFVGTVQRPNGLVFHVFDGGWL
jgi:hypothetical protein